MSKFMTTARKITAARIVGIGAGAGIMTAITKEVAVVLPAVGLATLGVAILHRKMKGIEEDESLTMGDLAGTAARSAAEVIVAAGVTAVAKNGINHFRNKDTVLTDAVAETVSDVVADVTPVV